MSYYYTYAVGTKKNNFVYLLSDIKEQRIWTKNPEKALTFYTEDEVQFIIHKFEIPHAAVARIKHKA